MVISSYLWSLLGLSDLIRTSGASSVESGKQRRSCNLGLQSRRGNFELASPIGKHGVYVTVIAFKGQLVVRLRLHQRAFHDPSKVFPTEKGIAMNQQEWCELMAKKDCALEMLVL